MTRHVVMFSGGVGSWAAATRVVQAHGRDAVTLLFADTLIEDADLYRFVVQAGAQVLRRIAAPGIDGLIARASATPPSSDMERRRPWLDALRRETMRAVPGLVWLAEGRTPWEVFRDERFLGNARVGSCSRVLKQEQVDAWLDAHCEPASTVVYVGLDWSEEHRLTRLRARRGAAGWDYRAPLSEAPYLDKPAMLSALAAVGIPTPRLYRLGFAHNNCGGGCVRAGAGHFAHLLRTLPSVYTEWESGEQVMREFLGRDDVAILRDRTGGTAKPLTLVQLRRRVEAGHEPDLFEIGGCGCFVEAA